MGPKCIRKPWNMEKQTVLRARRHKKSWNSTAARGSPCHQTSRTHSVLLRKRVRAKVSRRRRLVGMTCACAEVGAAKGFRVAPGNGGMT